MSKPPVGMVMAQVKQLQSRTVEKLLKINTDMDSLNAAQLNIIYQLWKEDDITISELSKRTQLANTTLTTMLDRLEHQGQILRCRNAHNRREIRIKLTTKSTAMENQVGEILQTMHHINFAGFSEEEETLMYSFLDRMKKNLETHATQS